MRVNGTPVYDLSCHNFRKKIQYYLIVNVFIFEVVKKRSNVLKNQINFYIICVLFIYTPCPSFHDVFLQTNLETAASDITAVVKTKRIFSLDAT